MAEPTYEEMSEIKDGYCEPCKGIWGMQETRCFEMCALFQAELKSTRKDSEFYGEDV